jgi:hypothetical protein
MRVALDDTPFEGGTKSFSYLRGTAHYCSPRSRGAMRSEPACVL